MRRNEAELNLGWQRKAKVLTLQKMRNELRDVQEQQVSRLPGVAGGPGMAYGRNRPDGNIGRQGTTDQL
jgi:hypothetical protein